jgi:hypothetical protein
MDNEFWKETTYPSKGSTAIKLSNFLGNQGLQPLVTQL